MDQTVALTPSDRAREIDSLTHFVSAAVLSAPSVGEPFFHLLLDRIFPQAVYDKMLALMPVADDYRPMHGRSRSAVREDGTPTRVKIDLFPEYIRSLPQEKRALWDIVGQALCSEEVKQAFMTKLAPGLQRRFGADFAKVRMYPLPVLTRDTVGYLLPPHTDTRWKGITVQLYLPPDDTIAHVGTIFNTRQPDGGFTVTSRMQFMPNTGYAFAVGDNTWHSAEAADIGGKSRDSILLTYFVDDGLQRIVRNRGKRAGNFILNEFRTLKR